MSEKQTFRQKVAMRPRAIRAWLIGIGLGTGGAVACVAAFGRTPEGTIATGISVAGLKIGGKSIDQAKSDIAYWSNEQLAKDISLFVEIKSGRQLTYRATWSELGVGLDVERILADADKVAKERSPLQHALAWFGAKNEVNLPAAWKIDTAKSKSWLKKHVAPHVYQEMRSARLAVKSDSTFEIKPEVPGRVLDMIDSVKLIEQSLSNQTTVALLLPIKVTFPHITSKDLSEIEGEVAHFQTHYGESGNRARNIETACSKINGTVLKPGDIFSYNKTVGPREETAGFKMAPVIIRGKLEPGMGGGVCQTSTTLYNAVLMAGLKIVRRSHHAFPVHYVSAGRDATVAYGSIDFQFQNDTTHSIAIVADGSDRHVSMRVFGSKTAGREVQLVRKPLREWAQSEEVVPVKDLPTGKRRITESGHPGQRVTLHRKIIQDGRLIKDEKISDDTYKAFPRIVEIGSAPVAKAASAAPAKIPTSKIVPPRSTRP